MEKASIFQYTVLDDGSYEFNSWEDAVFFVDTAMHSNYKISRVPDSGKAVVEFLCPT